MLCVPSQPVLAGIQKGFRSFVIDRGLNALLSTQLGDRDLTPKSLQDDPDLLIGGKLPAGPSTNLFHNVCGHVVSALGLRHSQHRHLDRECQVPFELSLRPQA